MTYSRRHTNHPTRIGVTNLKAKCGKSTCAVNLACEFAELRVDATDRWQGSRRVVLVDADENGVAMRYWSGCRLPVSVEHLPLDSSTDVGIWIERLREIAVDDVVVDGPSHLDVVTKAIMLVSDVVVVPCSESPEDLAAVVPTIALVKEARAARSDGGPGCLLVPTRVEAGPEALEKIESALRSFGETVGPAVHQSAEFADALKAGRWVGDYAPNGAAHHDIKALAVNIRSLVYCL